MKIYWVLFLGLFFCVPFVSFSQNVYKFIGNGSWKVAANWLNNNVPPATLISGDSIIIDPNGECILDAVFSVSNGVKLVVRPGKKFTIANNPVENTDSTFTDPRDGQKYPYKTIGSQVWMTKNFNYTAPGSACYNDNAANCDVYGRLYDWNTAKSAAPPGWHLPTDAEWTTLINFLGGENVAGGAMKDTTQWINPNIGATNSSGFAGLPGGNHYFDGTYNLLGESGFWWTATENSTDMAGYLYLYKSDAEVVRTVSNKNNGFSVRYVRDAVKKDSTFTDPRDGQVYPIKTIGTQVWMTKNLNYEAPGTYCYGNNAANCVEHGRLYQWNAALTAVPPGWHLPSKAEWDTLINFLGGESVAGGAMKDSILWRSPNTGATNSSGFSALPGGDGFDGIDYFGYWWSATATDTYSAWFLTLTCQNPYAAMTSFFKSSTLSVRCIKD